MVFPDGFSKLSTRFDRLNHVHVQRNLEYFSYRAILATIVSQNDFVLVFVGGGGVSHNYRAICCKMGYRTDVPV